MSVIPRSACRGSSKHHGGIHFGRRLECAGLHVEQQADSREQRRLYRQEAVVAGAGRGHQSLGDLLLNQEDGARKGETHRLFENRRRDVVGQVADNRLPAPLGQIGVEDVALDHLQARFAGKLLDAGAPPGRVHLHRDDACGALQEFLGERAAAGADFDHQIFESAGAGGRSNTLQDGTVDEKMLTEFLARHRFGRPVSCGGPPRRTPLDHLDHPASGHPENVAGMNRESMMMLIMSGVRRPCATE